MAQPYCRVDVVRCGGIFVHPGLRMAFRGYPDARNALSLGRSIFGACHLEVWVFEVSKQELQAHQINPAGKTEPLCFPKMVKLSFGGRDDRFGDHIAPFADSQTVLGDLVYWHWGRLISIQFALLSSILFCKVIAYLPFFLDLQSCCVDVVLK